MRAEAGVEITNVKLSVISYQYKLLNWGQLALSF